MKAANTAALTASRKRKTGQAREVWRRLRKSKTAMAGLFFLILVVLVAIFADVICDYETQVIAQDMSVQLQPPSAEHWFGTDGYGRDIFARVIHGARVSLLIGLGATVGSVLIAGLLGSSAGYYGGKVDNVIMRVMDMFMAIPSVLLALAIVAALGPSMVNLLIAVTISRIPPFTRIIRSAILTVVDQEYVEAGRACGANDFLIIIRHVLPNAIGPIIIQATMGVGQMILIAASLSFIGLGVTPPSPEWGSMLSEGREFMRYSPYVTIFPGIAIILTSLSLNLLGDGLRDALDPKLKN